MTLLHRNAIGFALEGRVETLVTCMYPAAESEAKVTDKEPLFVTGNYHFMTGFIGVMLWLWHGCIPMGYQSLSVLLQFKQS